MKNSLILLSIAVFIMGGLWKFQPKNIVGMRVISKAVKTKLFPFQSFDPVLRQLFKDQKDQANYDALIQDPASLKHYLSLIAEVGPQSAPHRFTRREERLAYALNAYQAALIAVIIQHCPLKSLSDPYWFNGIFWRVSLRIDGREQSINDLAAEVASLAMGDLRVYFTLNKGVVSGVPMLHHAWTPYNLEQGLQALQTKLLTKGSWLRFDPAQGILSLSGPFQWYKLMFTPSPLKYIQHHKPQYKNNVKQVLSHPIDWRLQGTCTLSL